MRDGAVGGLRKVGPVVISVPLSARLLLTASLLVGLVSTSQPALAGSTVREQVQPLTAAPDVIPLSRARLKGKWSIKVSGWAKPFKRGDQGRIDRCKATLWWGSLPNAQAKRPTWLAGHNHCGFWRWDKWLPVGSRFTMRSPRGKVRKYVVYDRSFVNRKSGSSAGLIRGDVTLQTCRGTGVTFVYARLVR